MNCTRSFLRRQFPLLGRIRSAKVSEKGLGTFGKVKLGTHLLTGQSVAIKIVDKIHAPSVWREIETWRRMQHPNIVQLFEILTTETKIYMVMEYVEGGELFDYVTQCGALDEVSARRLFKQLVGAIKYCHDSNFVHRDLKLENILIDHQLNIKIIDFGFTRKMDSKDKLMDTYCGSSAYAAPEMIAGQRYSGPEADVWSLGVILYTLVCGYLPFDDDNESVVHSKILATDYTFPDNLSADVTYLIKGILQHEPKERLNMTSILQHAWMTTSYDTDHSVGVKTNPEESLASALMEIDTELLEEMSVLGMDTASMIIAIRENACSARSSLYYLLRAKRRFRSVTNSGSLITPPEQRPTTLTPVNGKKSLPALQLGYSGSGPSLHRSETPPKSQTLSSSLHALPLNSSSGHNEMTATQSWMNRSLRLGIKTPLSGSRRRSWAPISSIPSSRSPSSSRVLLTIGPKTSTLRSPTDEESTVDSEFTEKFSRLLKEDSVSIPSKYPKPEDMTMSSSRQSLNTIAEPQPTSAVSGARRPSTFMENRISEEEGG